MCFERCTFRTLSPSPWMSCHRRLVTHHHGYGYGNTPPSCRTQKVKLNAIKISHTQSVTKVSNILNQVSKSLTSTVSVAERYIEGSVRTLGLFRQLRGTHTLNSECCKHSSLHFNISFYLTDMSPQLLQYCLMCKNWVRSDLGTSREFFCVLYTSLWFFCDLVLNVAAA